MSFVLFGCVPLVAYVVTYVSLKVCVCAVDWLFQRVSVLVQTKLCVPHIGGAVEPLVDLDCVRGLLCLHGRFAVHSGRRQGMCVHARGNRVSEWGAR